MDEQTATRPRSPRRALAAAAFAAALLAGCGGSHHSSTAATAKAKPPAPAPKAAPKATPPANATTPTRRGVKVVTAWADSLRAGRLAQAASYFALPAVVQNASPPYQLKTRADVRAFNASLPCGARVLRAVRAPGSKYTIVTFRLTERAKSPTGCGKGAGLLAATAFAFRHGKISEWIRVTLPTVDATPSGPTV